MRTIIKSQVAVLITMLTAFALTLTACGGGSSSSSAGGSSGSFNSAMITGTVSNNGVSSLDLQSASGLLVALSDAMIPVARADDANEVTVSCGSVPDVSAPVENGRFSVEISGLSGLTECAILVDGQSGGNVSVTPGSTTNVRIVYDDGGPPAVLADAPVLSDPENSNGLVAGDVTSSDDDSIASADDDSIASADDDSDLDSLDDESNDDDSDSPSDDDSDSKSPV